MAPKSGLRIGYGVRRAAPASGVKEGTSIYWMNTWIVWVQVSKEKVDGQVETTRATRHGRRKRGLRLGKKRQRSSTRSVRSRGVKPRRITEGRQPVPKEERSRPFNRVLRTLDFWMAKRDEIAKLIRDTDENDWEVDGLLTRRAYWIRRKVHSFNRGCSRVGEGAQTLSRPFSFLVVKYSGVGLTGSVPAKDTLRSWRSALRQRHNPAPVEEDLQDHGASRVLPVTRKRFCRMCGRERLDNLETQFCPVCTNRVTEVRAPSKRGRGTKRGFKREVTPARGNLDSVPERKQKVTGGCPRHPWYRMRSGVCRYCRVNSTGP